MASQGKVPHPCWKHGQLYAASSSLGVAAIAVHSSIWVLEG